MNKNIYIELADKLDSAGLFQESDDLLKVFSSSTFMIKTAQSPSPELASVLVKSDKLQGFTDILGIAGMVGAGFKGAIPAAVVTAIASYKNDQKELNLEFQEYKEIPDDPDLYNKKTIDATILAKVKAQADGAKTLPADQKTLVEVYIPNNNFPFEITDPASYTKEKYYLPDNITSKTTKGATRSVKNTFITKLADPYFYIKDLMNGNRVETMSVPKNKTVPLIPSSKNDAIRKVKKENFKSRIAKTLTAAILGAVGGAAYKFAEFEIHKKSIPRYIAGAYDRFIIKHKNSDKSKNSSAIIVQEFSDKLDSILSRCDGVSTKVPDLDYPKEKFRDEILKVFKKSIGYPTAKRSRTETTITNTSPTARPSFTPRKPRPTAPKPPASSGGSITIEGLN